jgi:hypothetical protein
MIHCLCGFPSIPLCFSLAAVLYRRSAYSVSFCHQSGLIQTNSKHSSFRAWNTGVSNPILSPRFRPRSVSKHPVACFRFRRSPTYQRISPLLVEFQLLFCYSSLAVSKAHTRLGRGISLIDTLNNLSERFTPNETG